MRSKRECERIHAKTRAYQRYGLILNREKLQAVVRDIKTGKATFVEKQSLRVSVFDVLIEGQMCRVVYDRHRHEVVTFLPNEESSHEPART